MFLLFISSFRYFIKSVDTFSDHEIVVTRRENFTIGCEIGQIVLSLVECDKCTSEESFKNPPE